MRTKSVINRAFELFLSSFCCSFPFALRNRSGQTSEGERGASPLCGQGSAAQRAKGMVSLTQFQPSKMILILSWSPQVSSVDNHEIPQLFKHRTRDGENYPGKS